MISDETTADGRRIAGIARSTESASISMLAAIDGTVDSMVGLGSVITGFDKMLSSFALELDSMPAEAGKYIDPDDEAIDALRSASSSLKDFLAKLVRKRGAIDCDSRLKPHHCEALHDAYECAEVAIANLIESAESLRALIIKRDLEAEPRDAEAFSTVEALVSSLRGK